MSSFSVKIPFDKTVGRLVWIPVKGNPVDIEGMTGKPFPILQQRKKELEKRPEYEKSKGKFKCKYLNR